MTKVARGNQEIDIDVQQGSLKTGGFNIAYTRAGKGPKPLLLVHGGAGPDMTGTR